MDSLENLDLEMLKVENTSRESNGRTEQVKGRQVNCGQTRKIG